MNKLSNFCVFINAKNVVLTSPPRGKNSVYNNLKNFLYSFNYNPYIVPKFMCNKDNSLLCFLGTFFSFFDCIRRKYE